ncbi:NifB/NifX family molybdenum-iron cluster-binding protein [Thermosulfuriphilus sp.]
MKICFAARGKGLSAPMDGGFGRAAYFIFYDPETGEFETLDNPYFEAQGSGIKVATMIAEQGAKVVVGARIGPKATEVLKRLGIKIFTGRWPTVKEALEAVQKGLYST